MWKFRGSYPIDTEGDSDDATAADAAARCIFHRAVRTGCMDGDRATRVEVWLRPSADLERDPEETRYFRRGVWEDGEWVEGDLPSMDGDTAADIVRRHEGRHTVVVDADERGELLDARVEDGLVDREEVFEAMPAPERS